MNKECDFCERLIAKEPIIKVIRKNKHIFCSETCYNLWFYKIPKFDFENMYSEVILSIPSDVVKKVLKEEVLE